jgi:hypothetical protein
MPIFDPDTGKVADRDALRSLQFNGQGMRVPRVVVDRSKDVKHVELVHEDHGGRAGYETHHASGRQDCTMTPDPVHLSLSSTQELK